VGGVISEGFVKEGDRVRKGELLAQIDADEYAAQHAQSLGLLRVAEEQEKFARRKWDDLKPEERAQYTLESERMRSVVSESAAYLQKTRIFAPFDGVVSTKFITEGTTVASGTPIVRIVGDLAKREIVFDIPAEIGSGVAVGDSVRVGDNDKTDDAIIYAIDPVADTQTRKVTIHAQLSENSPFDIGYFVDVVISSVSHINGYQVPIESIVRAYDDFFVFVIKDNVAYMQRVEVLTTGNEYAVIEGVQEGDDVVVSGAHALMDGDGVRVVDFDSVE
jgi:membrane fusion protein (multidrug efflux system)